MREYLPTTLDTDDPSVLIDHTDPRTPLPRLDDINVRLVLVTDYYITEDFRGQLWLRVIGDPQKVRAIKWEQAFALYDSLG